MTKNFIIKKGDEFSFTVTFKNLTKEPSIILFGLKHFINQEEYDYYLSIGNGIEKISDYEYSVRLSGDDTDKLSYDNYCYDLRFKVNETVKTPLGGKLLINETVFN